MDAPQVALRDRVSAAYNRVGTVKNADRVEVLEHSKRFVKVRTSRNEEGWMEQRYLVDQTVYDRFQKLALSHAHDPPQAKATTRFQANMHVNPGRETEKLFLLEPDQKVDLLERASVAKQPIGGAPVPAPQKTQKAQKTPAGGKNKKKGESKSSLENSDEPTIPMEDWWLVRDSQARLGWVLGRYLDVDVPLEIAQYAEGQRIVASFVLTEVQDPAANRATAAVPYYLVLMTEPKDGMPFDFNHIRVFSWNLKRHRYETAYRERGLYGLLPVSVGKESFEKEGVLPIFIVHAKDDEGNVTERKYKLSGVMVKRVLAPGERLTPTRVSGTRRGVAQPAAGRVHPTGGNR